MCQDMYIRAILPVTNGQKTGIIQMAVPGYDVDESGHLTMDFGRCQAALAELKRLHVRHYVCLTTLSEIGPEESGDIRDLVARQGITSHHLPIEDYAKPDGNFLSAWRKVSPQLQACLDAGDGVALQCLAGYGRSGTVAALLLIERGMAPDIAIETVKRISGESIESSVQLDFLLSRSAL